MKKIKLIMNRFQFLDKRLNDDVGEIIKYSSYEYSSLIAEKSIEIIKENVIFKNLCSLIPNKYIDLYFKKKNILPVFTYFTSNIYIRVG